jgi:hypothetical protein
MEALRLWPTTPMILRETVEETAGNGAMLPAGAELLIFAPYSSRPRAAERG